MPGSLVLGAATSDRTNCGSGATIANLDPCTYLLWVMPTTLTANRVLFVIGDNTQTYKRLRLSGTGGALNFFVNRSGVDLDYISSSTPLSATGVWACVAAVFDSAAGAGELVQIYAGTSPATLAECTYGTATDGTLGVLDDAAGSLVWGNGGQTAPTAALQGREAQCALFGAALSLADCQSWFQRPRVTVGANAAKGFWRLGNEGTGSQQDYSGNGNTGTVTGATQGDGPPLVQGENLWQQNPVSGLLTMAA